MTEVIPLKKMALKTCVRYLFYGQPSIKDELFDGRQGVMYLCRSYGFGTGFKNVSECVATLVNCLFPSPTLPFS